MFLLSDGNEKQPSSINLFDVFSPVDDAPEEEPDVVPQTSHLVETSLGSVPGQSGTVVNSFNHDPG